MNYKADAVGRRGVFLVLLLWIAPATLQADTLDDTLAEQRQSEPQWIWSSAHTKNKVPIGPCYFRKSMKLSNPGEGEIRITADNQFQLYVNGQPVGQGSDWRQIEVFDISKHLQKGINTVAIEAMNTDEGSAGVAARVLIKEEGGTFSDYSTNRSWKTSVRRFRNWTAPGFPESEWVSATSYGALGAALPWGNEMIVSGQGARFQIPEQFTVERLMHDQDVGSLIAMAFDAKGNLLVSREGGHLQILTDTDGSGAHDSVGVFCDQIKNTQGILSLGTRVFAVGDGPEGVALYRLRDVDRDGVADEIKAIVPIRGSRGEHGAHAVRLGPDGLLYVILGNHCRVGVRPGPKSPYRNWYEGDLVTPREEDPRGHAVDIPAPGGTIFRTDADGSFVELVAGGIRNSYDFAFNSEGEIFTYDADMEWDLGAPWYRPTRINHATAGAELGWRSGWAKWPESYLDSLPGMVDMGPGSPTGVEFYHHNAFPAEYRGALFGCDWATGKIHCVRFQRDGASYKGSSEVFVAGRPLNATDVAVGPEGALYFCTGGRGTDGGVYRIRYTGDLDDSTPTTDPMDVALQQPQFSSDWARAAIAQSRATMGANWRDQLATAAQDPERPLAERLQALDIMVLFGPRPKDELLLALVEDAELEVRAKATRLMYTSTSLECRDHLIRSLEDEHPWIRRLACEALLRSGLPTAAESHVRMLTDDDPFVAFAARKTLEQLPTDLWDSLVLAQGDIVGYCRGAATLLACRKDAATSRDILQTCQKHLEDQETPLTQLQLTSLLRVCQLALLRSEIEVESVSELGPQLLSRYPSANQAVDRELVRLLVYLNVEGTADKFAAQLQEDLAAEDKLHIGAYAAKLQTGWDTDSKMAMMKYYESARAHTGGYSVSAYVERFARQFFSKLTLAERQHILAAAERWPTSALSVLAKLPKDTDATLLAELRGLDERVRPLCQDDDRFRRLRVGILAVLGRSGKPESLEHLREVYRNEPDWRDTIAMSLTQHPGGQSWAYLVESLKTVRGAVAREVLSSLATVPQRPRESEPYRQVILSGLHLGDQGADLALALLNHWSGQEANIAAQEYSEQLKLWQQWYATSFPDAPPAELPVDSGKDKWSYEELLTYLESNGAQTASAERGAQAFTTAQCIKCHRCGPQGESLGPDLTTVSQRFQRSEILQSIVYPSHVISDQYASQQVLANGRTFIGLVVQDEQGNATVLLDDGEKLELTAEDIESIEPSQVSAMPKGLLNQLTLQQVADLFVFMERDHQQMAATEKPNEKR